MNKLALSISALALLGFAATANAGDMQDQGPIANTPALQAQAYAPRMEANADVFPQQVAASPRDVQIAASPRDVQIAFTADDINQAAQ